MSFQDEGPFGKLAEQRDRADIVIGWIAASVFAGSAASAAFFGRWILAGSFIMAAGIMVGISVFALKKFRRKHPGPRA